MSHSEQIGISTLEELSEQGEKLDRAEQRLHQIGELQKDSQRSVNALNSWWRSWFAKKYVKSIGLMCIRNFGTTALLCFHSRKFLFDVLRYQSQNAFCSSRD